MRPPSASSGTGNWCSARGRLSLSGARVRHVEGDRVLVQWRCGAGPAVPRLPSGGVLLGRSTASIPCTDGHYDAFRTTTGGPAFPVRRGGLAQSPHCDEAAGTVVGRAAEILSTSGAAGWSSGRGRWPGRYRGLRTKLRTFEVSPPHEAVGLATA